ncbi:hypothetical protein GCM10022423_26980 [Flavobacterium ginsengiterrae]|uniref:Uncharacterized protein n=2 Tax=Flavobacterium ginsengiterrae TaxID=871695 RepID=A0ABP7GN87_9FLAO
MTSSFNISEKMKLLLILFLFLVCFHGNSQQKKETTVFNEIKIDTMKILDLNIYRDWEVDLTYMQIPEIKYLKKGNERISIISTDRVIQVTRSNINNPYKYISVYDVKTKVIQVLGVRFKSMSIGTSTYYDDNGIKTKEIQNEKPYKFSLTDMIEKFKTEYSLDIENPKVLYDINRFIGKTELKIPLYEVSIREDFPYVCTSYLIDGNTGKTLYSIKMDEIEPKSVLHEYFKILKKQEEEDNAYFNTYKGKDYTKAEWEIFKEQHYKEYERKKESKGFWHDLFKKHDE